MTALGGERDETSDGEDFDTPEEEVWEEADPQELDLDQDEPLPWLESSDYEDEEGVDTGRIIGFAVLALAALGLLIGSFWFLTNGGNEATPVADGSTIEAPQGAIKERPTDPGGKEFAGTGDVAPAVGEGQTREGRLADGGGADGEARPGFSVPGEATGPAPAAGGATAATPAGAAFVQVGALSSKAGADQRWRELSGRSEALKGLRYRVEEAQIDNGTVYRLQAIAGDKAAANRLCSALKADGIECIVK